MADDAYRDRNPLPDFGQQTVHPHRLATLDAERAARADDADAACTSCGHPEHAGMCVVREGDLCGCPADPAQRYDAERAARADDDGLREAAQAVVDATDSYLVTSIGTVEAWEALVATIDALRAALDRDPAPALDEGRCEVCHWVGSHSSTCPERLSSQAGWITPSGPLDTDPI